MGRGTEKIKRKIAVVSINSDGNGRGPFCQGSHRLCEPFMDEIAKQVIDPQTGVSILIEKSS